MVLLRGNTVVVQKGIIGLGLVHLRRGVNWTHQECHRVVRSKMVLLLVLGLLLVASFVLHMVPSVLAIAYLTILIVVDIGLLLHSSLVATRRIFVLQSRGHSINFYVIVL